MVKQQVSQWRQVIWDLLQYCYALRQFMAIGRTTETAADYFQRVTKRRYRSSVDRTHSVTEDRHFYAKNKKQKRIKRVQFAVVIYNVMAH